MLGRVPVFFESSKIKELFIACEMRCRPYVSFTNTELISGSGRFCELPLV